MIKNTASQHVGAQMVSASDGSAFTGAVTVSVTGDAGTQATGSVGSGACTHEGNGYHTYAPAQAETNYNLVAFTFTGTGAIPATVQIYTITGDSFARLGAPAGASVSADIAAVKVDTAAILDDTGTSGVALANNSITAAKIADGAIDAATFASGAIDVNAIADNTITAGKLAANAITSAKIAAGAITSGTFAAGAIDATAIAANAIGASELAADAVAEIADAVWDEAIIDHVTAGSFGLDEQSANVTVSTQLDAAISSRLASADITLTAGKVTVGTNNDKTGYTIANGGIAAASFAAGAIDAASIAANAIGAAELAQDAAREIADEVLDRDIAGSASGGARNVRSALRRLRNKVAISAGTATVYQEDDSTSAWTAAVTTAAGDPVSAVDPA